MENLSTLSKGVGKLKKGEFSQRIANIGEITKIFVLVLCKTPFFPHAFPQAVEKEELTEEDVRKEWKTLWKMIGFQQEGKRLVRQILISFP